MIVYVAILTLIFGVIAAALISVTRAHRHVKSAKSIESAAITVMESVSREIRNSESVDEAQSILDSSPGTLFLNTVDDAGVSHTVHYTSDGTIVNIYRDGVSLGPLNSGTLAQVTSMIFRKIVAGNSTGVKIEFTVRSGSGPFQRSEDFYTTAALRRSLSF